MHRAIVLGGTGFIGRHVVAALTQGDDNSAVLSVGRASPEGREGAAHPASPNSPPQPQWLSLDLTTSSTAVLAEVLATFRPDSIINCVGRMDGTPRELFGTNTVLVDALLHATEVGAPSARFVHLGSAAEYGAVPVGQAVSEDDCPQPLSPYGVSKLAATQLAMNARGSGLVDAVVLRVFNPIGPGVAASSVLGRAATHLRRAIDEGATSIILGPLEAFRDFVDVRDVARAVVHATRATAVHGPVFNIAGGAGIQVRRAVHQLAAAAGFKGEIRELSAGSPRSAGVPWQQGDVERAATDLGWRPCIPFTSSIEAVWERYAQS